MTGNLNEALTEIREEKKCSNCICLIEILRQASSIDYLHTDHKHEFSKWIEEMNENDIHDCLGCNPCLPVEAYNLYANVSSDLV
jgi:hypothetical protein